jgi:hypothetical protein
MHWTLSLFFSQSTLAIQGHPRVEMTSITFEKATAPDWLLAFWKEVDDKTFGRGFECFAEDATCNLGVAQWKGREQIRQTTLHDVEEYWDGGSLKVFRGSVSMTLANRDQLTVHPVMTHFFYMDPVDPTKVRRWYGSVGPIQF